MLKVSRDPGNYGLYFNFGKKVIALAFFYDLGKHFEHGV